MIEETGDQCLMVVDWVLIISKNIPIYGDAINKMRFTAI